MIATKLIFQAIIGFGAIGGIVGGGYMMINSSETEYKYLIVTAGTDPTTKDLITNVNNQDTKNYTCEINVNSFDQDCEIFKINTTDDEKTIDFEKVLDKTNKLKANNKLTANKHYVLKLTKDKYIELKSKKTINILSKTKSEENKKYTELTIKHVVGDDLQEIKSNLIIVQATNVTTGSSAKKTNDDKLECKIEGQKDFFKCDIYKTSTDKTTSDFAFSDFSGLTKPETAEDIKAKNYYVLDLKNIKLTKEELRNKKITLQQKESETANHISDFIFEQLVLGDVKATSKIGFPVSPSNEIYYVSQLADNSSVAQPTKDLYEVGDSKAKNFKCKLSTGTTTNDEDVACEIFAMPEFDTTNKSIKFTDIKSAKTQVTEKTKLKAGKYFKLKINKNNMSTLNWTDSTNTTIDIVSTTASVTEKYASLKLLIKEEKEKLHGTTNLILGKASDKAGTTTTAATFKCKVGTDGTEQECDVYKFTSQPTSDKTYKDLIFAGSSKATAINDITDTHFYLINLKNNKYNLTSGVTKNVIVVTQNTAEKFNLTIESPLMGEIAATGDEHKLIFLK